MKISKLFHWLYGLVMLLPIFAIGVQCAYATFNKNAYQSYSGEQYFEERFITNDTELRENNGEYTYFRFQNNFENRSGTVQITYLFSDFELLEGNLSSGVMPVKATFTAYTTNVIIDLYNSSNNVVFNGNSQTDILVFRAIVTGISNTSINNSFLQYNRLLYVITDSNNKYIDNVFYYSIDKVQQSPLFNWAYNSFLVTPFAYIVSLFSMPTNSFVVMLLSYWLAISIIWLVFDLVMYVPLLVHRWLDRGIRE